MKPCQRCGTCCKIGICVYGKKKENGICEYLLHDGYDVYTCGLLVAEHKIKPEQLRIGKGCNLRKTKDDTLFAACLVVLGPKKED